MGLMTSIMGFVFGDGRNIVAETAEVFLVNAEADAQRGADSKSASVQQFAAEFQGPRRGLFDTLIDALNRLPRPMLAMGTIALFGAAMSDPVWFASRMEGLALVPEPLWWLMGAIVSFYFGARHQAKGQEFQAAIAQVMTRVPQRPPQQAAPDTTQNAALADWWATQE